MTPLLFLLIVVIFIIGIASMVRGYQIWQYGQASRAWPTVLGMILDSSIRVEDDPDFEEKMNYLRVRYEYQFEGTRYEGTRLKIGGVASSTDREGSQKRLMQYPTGKQVTVYVNPLKPDEATLEPGINYTGVIAFALVGAILSATALVGLIVVLIFGALT